MVVQNRSFIQTSIKSCSWKAPVQDVPNRNPVVFSNLRYLLLKRLYRRHIFCAMPYIPKAYKQTHRKYVRCKLSHISTRQHEDGNCDFLLASNCSKKQHHNCHLLRVYVWQTPMLVKDAVQRPLWSQVTLRPNQHWKKRDIRMWFHWHAKHFQAYVLFGGYEKCTHSHLCSVAHGIFNKTTNHRGFYHGFPQEEEEMAVSGWFQALYKGCQNF